MWTLPEHMARSASFAVLGAALCCITAANAEEQESLEARITALERQYIEKLRGSDNHPNPGHDSPLTGCRPMPEER